MKIALFALPVLAVCVGSQAAGAAGSLDGWRFASGKLPTKAEYAAIVAACEDGSVRRLDGESLETCLAELGLRRVQ